MSLLDTVSKVAAATDLDDKLLEKAGLGNVDVSKALAGVDESKITEITNLIKKIDFDKIDVEGIAKKVGVPANVVKAVMAQLKK